MLSIQLGVLLGVLLGAVLNCCLSGWLRSLGVRQSSSGHCHTRRSTKSDRVLYVHLHLDGRWLLSVLAVVLDTASNVDFPKASTS